MLDLVPENADAIEEHLRTLGWIAANERIKALTRAGEGNMNRTLRADLGPRTLILKQSVPFVAKYPAIPAPPDRIGVEAAFYRATRSITAIAARLPGMIGFDSGNRLLALEDLGPGTDFTDVYRGQDGSARIPTGLLSQLVDWLGALHGLRLDTAATEAFQNTDMRLLNHAHIFEIPFAVDNGIDLDAITPGLGRVACAFVGDETLKSRVASLGETYLGHASHASMPGLLHGDFYPGSWLHHPTLGVAIIDPEFAFVGPAEFDVGVLLAHLLFANIDGTEAITRYRGTDGFSSSLAYRFAGVEVMRRLLGVAQLPLNADLGTKQRWLAIARQYVMTAA